MPERYLLAVVFGGDGCYLWGEVDRFGEGFPGGMMGGPFSTESAALADANNEGFIVIPEPDGPPRRED